MTLRLAVRFDTAISHSKLADEFGPMVTSTLSFSPMGDDAASESPWMTRTGNCTLRITPASCPTLGIVRRAVNGFGSTPVPLSGTTRESGTSSRQTHDGVIGGTRTEQLTPTVSSCRPEKFFPPARQKNSCTASFCACFISRTSHDISGMGSPIFHGPMVEGVNILVRGSAGFTSSIPAGRTS